MKALAPVTSECRRLLRQGGLRRGVLILAALALLLGFGAVWGSSLGDEGGQGLVITLPVTVVAVFVSLVAPIHLIIAGSRDGQSLWSMGLLLVPRRRTLFVSRAVANLLVMLGMAFIVLTATLLAGLVTGGGTAGLARGFLGVAAGTVAVGCMALAGWSMAVIVDRGAVAILAWIGLTLLLPVGIFMVTPYAPPWTDELITQFTELFPLGMLIRAIGPTVATSQSWLSALGGMAGLAAWAGALTGAAFLIFRRRNL